MVSFTLKKSEFTEHNISLGLGYRFKDQKNQLDLYPLIEKQEPIIIGIAREKGFNISYSKIFNPNLYFSLQTEYKWEKYQDRNLSYQDGKILSFFSTLVYSLPNDWILFGGLDYAKKFQQNQKLINMLERGLE